MNEVYRNLTLVRAQATVAAARAFSGVDHRGLEGHLREIVMRDLLRPLLPLNIGLGSGKIISLKERLVFSTGHRAL